MKTRIIVELDNTGDGYRMSLRGEYEGDAMDNASLVMATAILKRRIAKCVDGFRQEEITLSEIAEVNNWVKAVKQ